MTNETIVSDGTTESVTEPTTETNPEQQTTELHDSTPEPAKEETPAEEQKEVIDYKLKLGEESILDNSAIDSVVEFAKEHNLSNEQAQKILENQDKAVNEYASKLSQDEDAMVGAWEQEVKDDKILGGENFDATVKTVQSVTKHFGSDEFVKVLNDTGYGSHPEVIRFMAKVGSAMKSDTLVKPQSKTSSRSIEDVFYGS